MRLRSFKPWVLAGILLGVALLIGACGAKKQGKSLDEAGVPRGPRQSLVERFPDVEPGEIRVLNTLTLTNGSETAYAAAIRVGEKTYACLGNITTSAGDGGVACSDWPDPQENMPADRASSYQSSGRSSVGATAIGHWWATLSPRVAAIDIVVPGLGPQRVIPFEPGRAMFLYPISEGRWALGDITYYDASGKEIGP